MSAQRRAWVIALGAAACAVYGSSLLVERPPDAGADASPSPDSGCASTRWPARPDRDDPPTSAPSDLVFALQAIQYAPKDGGARGYDLDGVCTCEGNPPGPESCTPVVQGASHCDGEGGVDDSAGALLAKLALVGDILNDTNINKGLTSGSGGALLRIQDWNGAPNDTKVTFSVYTSNGAWPPDDAGTRAKPSWDGGDLWSVDTASLVGGVAPPYAPTYLDASAYVSGGYLVATLDFPLVLGTRSTARTYVRLRGAVVTARLARAGASFSLDDGTIIGRWPTANLLTTLASFNDPLSAGGKLCGDSGTYQALKQQICKSADITSDLLSDRKNAPCDAISFAIFFNAVSAKFGPAEAAQAAPPPCGPSYMDDCR